LYQLENPVVADCRSLARLLHIHLPMMHMKPDFGIGREVVTHPAAPGRDWQNTSTVHGEKNRKDETVACKMTALRAITSRKRRKQ